MKIGPAVGAVLMSLAATGCVVIEQPAPGPIPGPFPPGPPRTCDAERAGWALGERAHPGVVEEARMDSGARIVRVFGPGDPVTMDFRPDRLNLVVSPRGRILEIRCG